MELSILRSFPWRTGFPSPYSPSSPSLRKRTQGDATENIPNDIMVGILSRLPANSILRLRCVCKSWFKFFSSTYPSVLIYSVRTGYSEFQQCYLTDTEGYLLDQVKILDPFGSPAGFQLLGTCHGLLFFYSTVGLKFCIWNPHTKEYKLLPPPPPTPTISKHERHVYGIGYDYSIDDYKVIRNSYYQEHKDNDFICSNAQVYRLGTNTWTSIGPNPYNLLPCDYKKRNNYAEKLIYEKLIYDYKDGGVFVNGSLYWIDSSYAYAKIISFDLAKETYQELSKHGNSQNLQKMSRLHLFEGSLCLVLEILDSFDQYYCVKSVEMWIMKDYGMNNNNKDSSSWTELLTIVKSSGAGNLTIKPLRYTNNGEILCLKNRRDLVLWDPKKRAVRTLLKVGNFVEEVYIGSFVSLNSGTYVGQEQKERSKNEDDNKRTNEEEDNAILLTIGS